MNQERKHPWWRSSNVLLAIIAFLAVWVLILISIIVDDVIGQREISLWEWVGVLVIPLVLATGAAWLNNSQVQRELTATNHITQDEALQKHLDQVGDLLVKQNLRDTVTRTPMSPN